VDACCKASNGDSRANALIDEVLGVSSANKKLTTRSDDFWMARDSPRIVESIEPILAIPTSGS